MFTRTTITLFFIALVIALIMGLLYPLLERDKLKNRSLLLPFFGLLSITFGVLVIFVIARIIIEIWVNYLVGKWTP